MEPKFWDGKILRCDNDEALPKPMENMPSEGAIEAVEDATAQLLIELAFLVPKGTDFNTHPISTKLLAYKNAIARRERDLAIAHDSQPYPTAEAYEKVCAALESHKQQLQAAQAETQRYKELSGELTATLLGMQDGSLLRDTQALLAEVQADRDTYRNGWTRAEGLLAAAQEQVKQMQELFDPNHLLFPETSEK